MASSPRQQTESAVNTVNVRRLVASLFADAEQTRPDVLPLEMSINRDDGTPPQLIGCTLLDDKRMHNRTVGNPQPAFCAFLDGKQESHPISFPRGLPVFSSTVAAVVRVRIGRESKTWKLEKNSLLCAPFRLLGVPVPRVEQLSVVDLSDTDDNTAEPPRHPLQLARLAYHAVERAREKLEEKLSLDWADTRPQDPLLVDGSISRTAAKAETGNLVGLVKSHRTMYLRNDEVETVLSLRAGERSSAFLIETRNERVASWYLRLRREPGSDPLWGLVRIEVPLASHSSGRADEVSRWVLAETAPVSLPDARWDRLIYGVRDCEMFLAAVM